MDDGAAVLPAGYQKALLEAYDDFMFTFKALKEDNFARSRSRRLRAVCLA